VQDGSEFESIIIILFSLSFDQQTPTSAFSERSACLFTILGQVTEDPKKNCVKEIRGRK
jgi:hypothetical protein